MDAAAPPPRPSPLVPVIIALALWLLAVVIISVLVVRDPQQRTVTWSLHQSTGDWWDRQDIYIGHSGMNYFPQFVLLFTPFHWISDRAAADMAWRLAGVGALVLGLVLLARAFAPNQWSSAFLWMTVLAFWSCLGAMRNAQPNLHFSAMQVLAAAMVIRRNWWAAAACIVVAIAVKPLGIVMAGLAPFVYPALWLPLLAGGLVLLALPFAAGPWGYVLRQHAMLIENFRDTATVTENRFADIGGIVRALGLELPVAASLVIRPLAGLATLVAWVLAGRRSTEPFRGLLLLSLASAYLMLFNPMTESNSYVIIAPAMAAVSVYLSDVEGRRRLGTTVAGLVLSIGLLPEPVRHVYPDFGLWWQPLIAAAFLGVVLYRAWLGPPPHTPPRLLAASEAPETQAAG